MRKLFVLFLLLAACSKTNTPGGKGELKILTFQPQGAGIPLQTEEAVLLFDHPMTPLGTLDSMGKNKLDLEITPSVPVEGKWLGTKGYALKFKTPLAPATTYEVVLKTPLHSLDGFDLPRDYKWKFTTVLPRITTDSTGTRFLMPTTTALYYRFNLSMDREDFEKKIQITNLKDNQPLNLSPTFTWEEDDHRVRIVFGKDLPWGSSVQVKIPAGIKARKGSLGIAADKVDTFEVPESELKVTKVYMEDWNEENPPSLKPSQQNNAEQGQALCVAFNQPVLLETARQNIKVEQTPPVKKKNPYIYGQSFVENWILSGSEEKRVGGYEKICTVFTDDYDTPYLWKISLKGLTSLSGASSSAADLQYSVKTKEAASELHSLLTKNIISLHREKNIPYKAINVKQVDVTLYRLSGLNEFSDSVTDGELMADDEGKNGTLFYNGPSYPMEPNGEGIKKGFLTPYKNFTQTIEGVPHQNTPFTIDLDQGGKIAAGPYLLEVRGQSTLNGLYLAPRYSMVFISPLAMALKHEANHLLAWVTDIETGQPVPQMPVEFQLEPYANSQKIMGVTNGDGVAIVATADSGKKETSEACAEVKGDQASYVCERSGDLTSYRPPLGTAPTFYAYLATDRPIYRPGQTVYYSSFVREVKEGRYFMPSPNEVFTVKVMDSAGGVLFENKNQVPEAGGILQGQFTLQDDSRTPRGNYSLAIQASTEQTFMKEFTVSSYRKPTFKVDLKVENKEVVNGDSLKGKIVASYFFGGALKKAKANWSLMTTTYLFNPEGYGEYSFLDPDLMIKKSDDSGDYVSDYEYDLMYDSQFSNSYGCPVSESASQYDVACSNFSPSALYEDPQTKKTLNELSLDEKGEFSLQYTPKLQSYPTSQVLTLEASVEDAARQEVSASQDIIVHKADFYLGLKPKSWVYGEKQEAQIDVVALTPQGGPLSSKDFKVDVIRREYNFIEKRNSAGNWDFYYEPKDEVVTSLSDRTGSDGKKTVNFVVPRSGTYRLVVKGEDKKGNSIQASSEIFASGEGYTPWKLGKPEELKLVPDKSIYKVGDTAHILVQSFIPMTKALMTLERGRVLDYKIIQLGNNASVIDLPIEEGMRPNLFMSVVAHTAREKGHPPMLFYGETLLKVDPESRRLKIKIAPNQKEYKPGDTVQLKLAVSNSTGSPQKAHLVVSAVDESVLKLKGYELPDLVKKFYYQRPNSVSTSSSLLLFKAGDGGDKQEGKRKNFKDTAFFSGHVITDANGEATVNFKLPDDLTTWVVDVLAITESKTWPAFEEERKVANSSSSQKELGQNLSLLDNTYVGSVREKFVSTLPVLARFALPRFAAQGDQMVGRVILSNRGKTTVKGKLELQMIGDGSFEKDEKSLEKEMSLEAQGEQIVPFSFKATKDVGKLTVVARLTDDKGSLLDNVENSLPIKERYLKEVVATSGSTTTSAEEKIDLSEGEVNEAKLVVSIKPTLALAIVPALQRLMDYPYACAEQKSATLLSLLMIHSLVRDLGEKYLDSFVALHSNETLTSSVINQKIKSLLEDLKNYQVGDGGISYWKKDSENLFASTQSLWAFSLAQDMGFEVDPVLMEGVRNYIQKEISKPTLSLESVAFSTWVLALDAKGNILIPERLLSHWETLSTTGLSYFLQTLTLANQRLDVAEKVQGKILSLSKQDSRLAQWPESGDIFWATSLKNTTLAALALLDKDPQNPVVPKAFQYLLNRKKVGISFNTQDDLYLSWLAIRWMKTAKEDQTNYAALVLLDQDKVLDRSFNNQSLLEEGVKETPVDPAKPHGLHFSKKGQGTLYYQAELHYSLPLKLSSPREEGILISRKYYAVEDEKEEEPLTEFEAGKNYKGHITLIIPQEMNYVLVEDLLPAGFEPVDMNLATSSKAMILQIGKGGGRPENRAFEAYDDVFQMEEYSSDYFFSHSEVRDDSLLWSDTYLPAGVYHIRYPLRATTPGSYVAPGAWAFEFYNPEVFGRSSAEAVEIKD